MAPFAIPEEGSPERAAFETALDEAVPPDQIEKHFKKLWKETVAFISAQSTNGAGLSADITLRDVHHEYNYRLRRHGLRSLPFSVNVLEAFFQHLPSIVAFWLRPERNHLLSWPHFFDWVTSEADPCDSEDALDGIPDETVLNYSNLADPAALMFSHADGPSFGAQAVSLIRHGAEVTVVFTDGQAVDLEAETRRVRSLLEGETVDHKPYVDQLDVPQEAFG